MYKDRPSSVSTVVSPSPLGVLYRKRSSVREEDGVFGGSSPRVPGPRSTLGYNLRHVPDIPFPIRIFTRSGDPGLLRKLEEGTPRSRRGLRSDCDS